MLLTSFYFKKKLILKNKPFVRANSDVVSSVCELVSRKHGEHCNEKKQISWMKTVYHTVGIRSLFTDYFKSTSAYIGFWFLSTGIIHETHNWSVDAANKAIICLELKPFKPCRWNFCWSAVFFLEPVQPLTKRNSRKVLCHNYKSMTSFSFFFSLSMHPFSISTLILLLLIHFFSCLDTLLREDKGQYF